MTTQRHSILGNSKSDNFLPIIDFWPMLTNDDSSKMLYFYGSDYLFNSLLYHAYQTNKLTLEVIGYKQMLFAHRILAETWKSAEEFWRFRVDDLQCWRRGLRFSNLRRKTNPVYRTGNDLAIVRNSTCLFSITRIQTLHLSCFRTNCPIFDLTVTQEQFSYRVFWNYYDLT